MKRLVLATILALILAGSDIAASDILTIRVRKVIDDARENKADFPHYFSARSRENLINLDRISGYSLPKAALTEGTQDTITIIAFKIGFVYEDPDDPLTTGRGTFDLRTQEQFLADEGHTLDPAPHNNAYFMAHLRSLAHYWNAVSNDKLVIQYEVWPQDDTGYYQLDNPMAYYGAVHPAYGLGAYFHDALTRAYEIDGGNFSFRETSGKKKAIILFHAGADRQTDLWFSATPTPYDLFTGFATFDADNWLILGNDTLAEGTIMPETMTQDNRVTVMNAVMAHEFGHQLGLADLYNTGSSPFLTQLGDFALMDNNGMNTAAYIDEFGTGVFGTVPIFPMAWSRAYLGFDDVYEFTAGTNIELAAVKMRGNGISIAKIPISPTEYYLLENRRTDVDGGVDALQIDSTSNVVLFPIRLEFVVNGDVVDTLRIPVAEYDLFLPGGSAGIAVWHIDEKVAAMDYFPYDIFDNNFDANTVQWDPNRRFISLVEADGIIDFGGNYYSGFGRSGDLFSAENNATFNSTSNPPTIGYDGGYTHINISNISPSAMTMSFDVTQDKMASGFPRRTAMPVHPDIPAVAADLDNDGSDEILAVRGNHILAMTVDGNDYLDPNDDYADIDTVLNRLTSTTIANNMRPIDTAFYSIPLFAELDTSAALPPRVIRLPNDSLLVVAGDDNGKIYTYLPYSTSGTAPDMYRATLLTQREPAFPSGQIRQILFDSANMLIYGFYEDGNLYAEPWDHNDLMFASIHDFGAEFIGACRYQDGLAVLASSGSGGSFLFETRFAPRALLVDTVIVDSVAVNDNGFHMPIATDLNRDGNDEIILLTHDGHLMAYSFDASGINKYDGLDLYTNDTAAAGPAVGDFSGDGYPEIVVSGTDRVYAFDRNGLPSLDFPLTVDRGRQNQLILTEPVIGDINGDGLADVAVTTLDSIVRNRSVDAIILIDDGDSTYIIDTTLFYAYYNYYTNLYVVSPGLSRVQGFPVPAGVVNFTPLNDTLFEGPDRIRLGIGAPVHLETINGGMLVSYGADGAINAWNCGWSDDEAIWSMAGGDATGSRYVALSSLPGESVLSELLPENRFFNYPNPVTGDETKIRFYVNQPADVTLTIIDDLGDEVQEFFADISDGNRDHEITWNVSGVPSGIYHCRIEAVARGGSESKIAFKTIAVVK